MGVLPSYLTPMPGAHKTPQWLWKTIGSKVESDRANHHMYA